MRWAPAPVSLGALLLLPLVCASSCGSGCASEKCPGGPPINYLVRGSLVTMNRVAGHTTSRPTAGRITVYAGAVPGGIVASTSRTTRSGTFEVNLSPGTYYFGGKADGTGVTCTSDGPFKVGTTPERVTIRCPSH